MPQAPRNLQGQRLTKQGLPDQRKGRTGARDNAPTHNYYVRQSEYGGPTPWRVYEIEIATGATRFISRHRTEKQAHASRERQAMQQPNRRETKTALMKFRPRQRD